MRRFEMNAMLRATSIFVLAYLTCCGLQEVVASAESVALDRNAPPAQRTRIVVIKNDQGNESNESCSSFRNYPRAQQCDFIKGNTACDMDGGYINYLLLPYCLLSGYEALGLTIIVLWMMYIFFALSVVVDLVLCPSLKLIASSLNMDEDVAGVTLLAFGNGAADIFSLLNLVLRSNDDGEDEDGITGEAGMGSILGGGVFVVCVSAGLISINYPLNDIDKWSFVRNVLFYLIAVAWLTGMLADHVIYLGEAIGFICLYVVYVFIVWVGHRLSRRREADAAASERTPLLGDAHSNSKSSQDPSRNSGTTVTPQSTQPTVIGRGLQGRMRDASALRESAASDLTFSTASLSQSDVQPDMSGPSSTGITSFPDVDRAAEPVAGEVDARPDYIVGFQLMRDEVFTEELRRPKTHKWYAVLHAVLAFPVRLAVLLTCPIVDQEKKDLGWNKYLTMVALLVCPSFAAIAFEGYFQKLSDELILGPFLAILGFVLAMAVLLLTSVRRTPSAIVLFAVIAFLMSICWIYILADEVVSVVVTLSIALGATGSILGLLMIAIGNSVCDLIANFFVARSGKPLMGFAASYGSPLLNLLIGVGIATTAAILKEGKEYSVTFPLQLKVASGFLCAALLLALALVFARRWSAGRLLGICLLVLYLVFFTVILTLELADPSSNTD